MNEKGIRVFVIDKKSVLPKTTTAAAEELQRVTQNNRKIILNIVIGYISKY